MRDEPAGAWRRRTGQTRRRRDETRRTSWAGAAWTDSRWTVWNINKTAHAHRHEFRSGSHRDRGPRALLVRTNVTKIISKRFKY